MDKTPALPAHEVRPQFEYVYHWHRIIPAMASLAIGVGAVLWFWPSTVSNDGSQTAQTLTEPAPSKPLKAESVVVDLPLQINKPAEAPTKPTAAAAPQTAANTTATSPAGSSASAKPGTVDSVPSAQAQKLAALKAINEAPAPSAGMKPGQVLVVDKSVKNVALQQVIDHDPLELAKGSIGLTKKKAVKVVFSANVGKSNEQVNYLWYLNGKLQAKVATLSSAEATSQASKFISYDAPGAWQVQMINADGKVLAESAFTAKRVQ